MKKELNITKYRLLPVIFCLLLTGYLRAQVTIGGMTDPQAGTLLDLNSTAKGALLFSNVSLTDLKKIPAGAFVGITAEQDNNPALAGAVVYNTNPAIGTGLYVWEGAKWTTIMPGKLGEVGVMIDNRDDEEYYTGNFGTAGIWMLENLRYVPAGYAHNTLESTSAKYYAFPGTDGSYNTGSAETGWDKSWGILYNWAGATNGRSLPSTD
ncbi:MAG: hypothetical protein LBH12_00510, partial [Dysgonamonadaceae bacterium]|nr:hypothetical protein [Dysgonamonadaceae bacterium]